MNDDVMDDDLLAPPGPDGTLELSTSPSDEGWHSSHGFPDSRRAVRIWVDPDTRQLLRVRLSNRWRERLAGHSLSDAFFEAFFLANTRFCESQNLEVPSPEIPEPAGEPNYEDLMERVESLMERAHELDSRAPENVRWADFRGEPVRVAGRGVSVTLSLAGLTERVEFDREWLAQASNASISEQVLSVHRQAYERYVPPVFVPGEREELALEFQQLQMAVESLMSKGIA